MRDMKEGLASARKADTTHVRKSLKVYVARACEYGSAKYERANYARPAADFTSPKADFERFRKYLRAAVDHIEDTLTAMERHQAGDPNLLDVEGLRRAAYAEDTDTKPGCPVGPSGLPHVSHAAASLMMALEQATLYGLLPADPGQPWAERAKEAAGTCEHVDAPHDGPGPCVDCFMSSPEQVAAEQRVGDGEWNPLELAPVPDPDEVNPPSGAHTQPWPPSEPTTHYRRGIDEVVRPCAPWCDAHAGRECDCRGDQ